MLRIYLNYFSNTRILSNDILVPIQVGRALSEQQLDMIGDDTGENISKRNPEYCEMTGLFWVWKNDLESDYIGFMHYRRFLDFHPEKEKKQGVDYGLTVPEFDGHFLADCGLDKGIIEDILQHCDGIIPEPLNVKRVGCKNVEEHYRCAPYHRIADFKLAREIITELYPQDVLYFDAMAKGHHLYPCNIFVFKRALFEEYCEWVFPLLDKLYSLINLEHCSASERRAIGFLAERLFTVFILKKKEASSGIHLAEQKMVIVEDTSPDLISPELPDTDLPIISVVTSSDRAYLPHIAALVHSIFDNTEPDSYVDLMVLDGGLTDDDRKLIGRIPALYHKPGRVLFLDMSRKFLSVQVHYYFSRGTLYRVLLPDLLKNHDRILYLDADVIVLSDLGDLYNIDLEGKSVAAAKDLVMKSFVPKGVLSLQETGSLPTKSYLSDYLGMKDKIDEYFQAGILVFDLEKMRKKNYSNHLKQDLFNKRFWFLDQDVLNKNLLGDVLFFDNRWNSIFMDREIVSFLRGEGFELYQKSIQEPHILHFAGIDKPWLNDNHPQGYYYWHYLRKTYWYEPILRQYIVGTARLTNGGEPSFIRRVLLKGWKVLPGSLKRVLRPFAQKISQKIL